MLKRMNILLIILSLVPPINIFAYEKNITKKTPSPIVETSAYDEVVIDIGMLHNYVTNWTCRAKQETDQQTFIIGRNDLKYPSMSWLEGGYADNHYLYGGCFWVGYNDNVIRFSTDTSDDFKVIRDDPSQPSPFEVSFSMTDERADPAEKVGIKCTCKIHAWPEYFLDDFLIYEYIIQNQSGKILDNVYACLYIDLDVSSAEGGSGNAGFWRDDLAGYHLGTDKNGQLESISYMYDGENIFTSGTDKGGRLEPRESLGFIGSRVLESPPTKHGVPANQQSGHIWTDWGTWPSTGADKYRWMKQETFWEPPPCIHDYRIFQTMGPWDIESKDSLHLSFAIGIGEGLEGMRENLQKAFELYWNDFNGPFQPCISGYSPLNDSLVMYAGDTIRFQVDAFDKNGDELTFYWTVDGYILNAEREPRFSFNSNEFPVGMNTIVANVMDRSFCVTHEWTVEIKPAKKYAFYPNFPNPFNSTTTIRFEIKQDGLVQIELYDILGRKVKTLLEENLPFGVHEIAWDGTDDNGTPLPGGCYFYRIRADEFKVVKKMVLIK